RPKTVSNARTTRGVGFRCASPPAASFNSKPGPRQARTPPTTENRWSPLFSGSSPRTRGPWLPRRIVSRTATSTEPLPRSKPDETAPRISVFSKRTREPRVVVPSARTSVNGWFAGLSSVMVQFRTVRFAPVQQKSEVSAAVRSLRFTIKSRESRIKLLPSRTITPGKDQTGSRLGRSIRMMGWKPGRARISRDSPETRKSLIGNGPSSAISIVPLVSLRARRSVGKRVGSRAPATRRTWIKGPSTRVGTGASAHSGRYFLSVSSVYAAVTGGGGSTSTGSTATAAGRSTGCTVTGGTVRAGALRGGTGAGTVRETGSVVPFEGSLLSLAGFSGAIAELTAVGLDDRTTR